MKKVKSLNELYSYLRDQGVYSTTLAQDIVEALNRGGFQCELLAVDVDTDYDRTTLVINWEAFTMNLVFEMSGYEEEDHADDCDCQLCHGVYS